MRTVDHRLALSRPALLSAPDKKSFSSVSSPILACSSFRSTGGVTSDAAAPGPKTPAAPSCSWAFQAVIWCGWTSKSLANSASVFSPLIAASATFALKPGLCVRHARFVILAPDLRHLRRCQADTPLIGLSEFPEPPLGDAGARLQQHHRQVPDRAVAGGAVGNRVPARLGGGDQIGERAERLVPPGGDHVGRAA